MGKVFDAVLRVGVAVAMAGVVAGCGGTDVHVGQGTGVSPTRGVFEGQTATGGDITIEVGSIEVVTFDCDGTQVRNIFVPPGDVDVDGSFDLRFNVAGRHFRFKGQFATNDFVEGSIDDEDDECDVVYSASRTGSAGATTTPVRTATPGPGATATATIVVGATSTATPAATATEAATPTVAGPTATPVPGGATATRTATPAAATVTPTPAPTPFCGNGVKDAGEACDTGANFGASDADCATQCACCYCRPEIAAHAGPNMSACSGCHGMGAEAAGLGPKPPKPGAVETFGAKCN
jgi:hypothetical protein